jgi:hypothetical protein
LGSISNTPDPCRELLDLCLRGEDWSSRLLDRAIAVDDGRALLSVVVERLGDLFEPRLCDVYTRLFTQVIARVTPELGPRVRWSPNPERPPENPARVYVLSRVTLGADVAVTSVLLDAAKRRYPDTEILFVGPRKNFELFENDPRIGYRPAPYARAGTLAERLRASAELWLEGGMVLDPDSRLTQLGLISVCPEHRYFLFESRSYGGSGDAPLAVLASRWAKATLGVEGARPYVAPRPIAPRPIAPGLLENEPASITVSLGVGENPAKGLGHEFERELTRILSATGASVLVDKGASDEERRRVESVLQPGMRSHDGAFAPFAVQIARSKLFVGYDSAGGHVASACGVPLISIAAGFVSERMQARWRPQGTVIRVDDSRDRADVIGEVRRALSGEVLSRGIKAFAYPTR